MLISPKVPLSLERIAILWSDELNEDDFSEVMCALLVALVTGELRVVPEDRNGWVLDAHCRDLGEAPSYLLRLAKWRIWRRDGYDVHTDRHPDVGVSEEMRLLLSLAQEKVSRDEFLRWVGEAGYPPPEFWDVGEAKAPSHPEAEQNSGREYEAPHFDRVVAAMEADIAARRATIEGLRKNKKLHAATYNTSVTTAYEAAKEVERRQKRR